MLEVHSSDVFLEELETDATFSSGSNTDYKSSEPLKTLVMLCYAILLCYYVMLRHVTSRHVMSCHVMLCYVHK